MRNTILGGLTAMILGLSPLAHAVLNPTPEPDRFRPTPPRVQAPVWPQFSKGAGMDLGNEPGHSAGPGGAKVDQDFRGIVNDIQVGRGTDDTLQSANPPPAHPKPAK